MDTEYLIRQGTFQIGRNSTTTLTEQEFSFYLQEKTTIKGSLCELCRKAILCHKISYEQVDILEIIGPLPFK
jgi:hypothetical protein